MNIREQVLELDTLIGMAEIHDLVGLRPRIKKLMDDQDVVTCLEGECICNRFDLAMDAVDADDAEDVAKWLGEARGEFVKAIQERIESLEERNLEDDDMEEAEYQGNLEIITRLEGIIEDKCLMCGSDTAMSTNLDKGELRRCLRAGCGWYKGA